MTDNTDELAQLGQQVLDAIVATYNPEKDSSLALALHPGQALADGIVQGGVTNELRLSTWLEDQYDYPLKLKLADGTPVVSTTLGGITAKSAYVTMAKWSQPAIPPDSAAFQRIAQLIADARKDVGEQPELLQFGCEPTDFAQADCPAWQVFDTVITTHASTRTTTPAPPDSGVVQYVVDPELWKLRAVPEEVIAELPRRRMLRDEAQALSQQVAILPVEMAVERLHNFSVEPDDPRVSNHIGLSQLAVAEAVAEPAVTTETYAVADTVSAISLSAAVMQDLSFARSGLTGEARMVRPFSRISGEEFTVADTSVGQPELAVQPDEVPVQNDVSATYTMAIDATLAQELVHVNVADLAAQPSVSTTTTSDSSLHVHFEYLLLTITRRMSGRPWWRPDFLKEEAWFVPGMKRGAMVPPAEDPEFAQCLPQSLLLVRNVSLTGVWSDEAREAMKQKVHYFGPFLMAPPEAGAITTDTEAQRSEQTTITGMGVQVIGELCGRLPTLPPKDDPALVSP